MNDPTGGQDPNVRCDRGGWISGPMLGLTPADRRILAEARQLAELRTTAAVTERFPGWDDPTAAWAEFAGYARWHLAELAIIIDRLAGEG